MTKVERILEGTVVSDKATKPLLFLFQQDQKLDIKEKQSKDLRNI